MEDDELVNDVNHNSYEEQRTDVLLTCRGNGRRFFGFRITAKRAPAFLALHRRVAGRIPTDSFPVLPA